MSQSRGIAQPAEPVVSLYEELTDVLDRARASMAVPSLDMMQTRNFDLLSHEEKMREFIREGYYGFSNDILEKNNDTGLQPTVQEVANRYLSRTEGRNMDHGPLHRDKSKRCGSLGRCCR